MKKTVRITLVALGVLGAILVLTIICSLMFKSVGYAVVSACLGSRYGKVAETTLCTAKISTVLPIYKAKNKPFLILGPYPFDYDYYDFFFVSKTRVIRTATDKGGDIWAIIGNQLFLFDDLTNPYNPVRAPYWDDIARDPDSSIVLDSDTEAYVYSFKLEDKGAPVSFSIPAALFTADMPDDSKFVFKK